MGLGMAHVRVTPLLVFHFSCSLLLKRVFLLFVFFVLSFQYKYIYIYIYIFIHISLLASVSEFNCRCFLRSRCHMEMWCPDDMGRDSWDWVGPPTWKRA